MSLTPFDEGAFRRQLGSSGSVERRSPTRPQRWIQDEATTQWDELTAVAKVTKRALDLEGEIAENGQSVFARTAAALGSELDNARSRYGTEPAPSSPVQFRGSHDVPALLAAFTRNTVINLGSAVEATQQLGNRNLAEVVARGLTPPADTRITPRPGLWGWWTNSNG